MELCCICHKMIKIGDTGTLTIGKNDIDKEVCAKCERQIDILTNSDNVSEIKSAINYLYSYKVKNDDEEVTSYLNDILEANSSVLEDVQGNSRLTGTDADYFKDKEESTRIGFGGQYSICNQPDKIAVSIFSAAKTTNVLGIIAAAIYFILGAIRITSSQLFVLYLALLSISLLIFFAFSLIAKLLKGLAAIVQNTRDTAILQKYQTDGIAELIKKCNK